MAIAATKPVSVPTRVPITVASAPTAPAPAGAGLTGNRLRITWADQSLPGSRAAQLRL